MRQHLAVTGKTLSRPANGPTLAAPTSTAPTIHPRTTSPRFRWRTLRQQHRGAATHANESLDQVHFARRQRVGTAHNQDRTRRRARAHRGVRLRVPAAIAGASRARCSTTKRESSSRARRTKVLPHDERASNTSTGSRSDPTSTPALRTLSNEHRFTAGWDHFNAKRARARGQRPPWHIHRLGPSDFHSHNAAANERGVVGNLDLGPPSDDVPAIHGHTRNTGGTRVLRCRENHGDSAGRWGRRCRQP